MTAQWARMMGAAQILVFDLIAEKLAMARRLGFHLAFNARECKPVEQIRELTRGHGAEVCVEAAGVPATLTQAIAAARDNGRVVILGNPSGDVTLPAALDLAGHAAGDRHPRHVELVVQRRRQQRRLARGAGRGRRGRDGPRQPGHAPRALGKRPWTP